MLGKDESQQVEAEARRLGVEPAALTAVVTVESGGRIFARIGERREPVIRFEGHYFDRLCPPGRQEEARRLGLASPDAGAVANPASQAARWGLLERAARIDRSAAYRSTSWGIGQVMGEHWHRLGFPSVEAMVAEARSGFSGQLRLMTLYIEHAGLASALRERNWEAFARGYNGPAFRRFGYHERLAAAYAGRSSSPRPRPTVLRRGDAGERVLALQSLLVEAGEALGVDGRFGPATDRAVRSFQGRKGLAVDGLAGPDTIAALQSAPPPASGPFAALRRRIARICVALSGRFP